MPLKGKTNNPAGRPKGIVNARVRQWESLADAITGRQSLKFELYMDELWESEDPKDRHKAAQLFIQTLEYFKPKQARLTSDAALTDSIQVIISDKI
jgi:hypothetical protein